MKKENIVCDCCREKIFTVAKRDSPELYEAKQKLTIISKQLEQLRVDYDSATSVDDRDKVRNIERRMDFAQVQLARSRREIASLRIGCLEQKEEIFTELLNITRAEIKIARRRVEPLPIEPCAMSQLQALAA